MSVAGKWLSNGLRIWCTNPEAHGLSPFSRFGGFRASGAGSVTSSFMGSGKYYPIKSEGLRTKKARFGNGSGLFVFGAKKSNRRDAENAERRPTVRKPIEPRGTLAWGIWVLGLCRDRGLGVRCNSRAPGHPPIMRSSHLPSFHVPGVKDDSGK